MPKYLDLFAGAGGLSEGFVRAGYEPVAHVEMDVAACYTLKTRAAYHWLKKQSNLALYNKYLNSEISRTEYYNNIPEGILNSVLNYEISSETLDEIFADIIPTRCRHHVQDLLFARDRALVEEHTDRLRESLEEARILECHGPLGQDIQIGTPNHRFLVLPIEALMSNDLFHHSVKYGDVICSDFEGHFLACQPTTG